MPDSQPLDMPRIGEWLQVKSGCRHKITMPSRASSLPGFFRLLPLVSPCSLKQDWELLYLSFASPTGHVLWGHAYQLTPVPHHFQACLCTFPCGPLLLCLFSVTDHSVQTLKQLPVYQLTPDWFSLSGLLVHLLSIIFVLFWCAFKNKVLQFIWLFQVVFLPETLTCNIPAAFYPETEIVVINNLSDTCST